jgi:hypothetical protein
MYEAHVEEGSAAGAEWWWFLAQWPHGKLMEWAAHVTEVLYDELKNSCRHPSAAIK